MPIKKLGNKWFYGNQGPFESREKAVEVAQAIHANEPKLGLKKKKREKK